MDNNSNLRRNTALKRSSLSLALATVATAGGGVVLPNLAYAQLEEVVVTARARSESLQDVPATVTAFTESQIRDAGIQRAEDFVYMTPGVTFVNTVEWETASCPSGASMAPGMAKPTLPLSSTASCTPTPRRSTASIPIWRKSKC